jgi:hypothetical protein
MKSVIIHCVLVDFLPPLPVDSPPLLPHFLPTTPWRGVGGVRGLGLGDHNLPGLLAWGEGGGDGLILPYLHPLPRHWGWVTATCLTCWLGGINPPLSTSSPAPLGLGDSHLPGLLVWGGGVD